ncbi:MAG TPA: hypothetical protein VMP11_06785 [Verrucomicrobiae bacterium]|nr:hypothetical protein [Verrucomicrobiae bacterium]
MAKLKTVYKVRAQIPARVVERSGLLSNARKMGLNLAVDDTGNIEGAWDASLLTLASVLRMLEEAGVQSPLIQRRVVTLVIAADVSKTNELDGILSDLRVSQTEDLLSNETVFHCTVTCEEVEGLLKRIQGIGIKKFITTEAYEVV